MRPGMPLQRAYLFVVMGFTLFVGQIGFFTPQDILRALPWPMPPLHARFVGSLYLGATLFVGLAMLARTRLQARTVIDVAFVWTGWLLLITMLHWSSFDFGRVQVWYWVGAYIAFPLVAGWLSFAGAPIDVPARALITDGWVLVYLRLLGLLLIALAALLFLMPERAVLLWPWKITGFLAQVYSGPVLGLGVGSLLLARRRNWPETLIPTLGMLTLSSLSLLASTWHLGLFAAGSPSMLIWFGLLAGVALMSLLIAIRAITRDGHRG